MDALESVAKLEAATAAVDAAAKRHSQNVAGVVHHVVGTANTGAKVVAVAALLCVRYVAGFVHGLRSSTTSPNA